MELPKFYWIFKLNKRSNLLLIFAVKNIWNLCREIFLVCSTDEILSPEWVRYTSNVKHNDCLAIQPSSKVVLKILVLMQSLSRWTHFESLTFFVWHYASLLVFFTNTIAAIKLIELLRGRKCIMVKGCIQLVLHLAESKKITPMMSFHKFL